MVWPWYVEMGRELYVSRAPAVIYLTVAVAHYTVIAEWTPVTYVVLELSSRWLLLYVVNTT